MEELITAWGESKTAKEWATDERCGVSPTTIKNRMKKKWTAEQAIGTAARARIPEPTNEDTALIIGVRTDGRIIVIYEGVQHNIVAESVDVGSIGKRCKISVSGSAISFVAMAM